VIRNFTALGTSFLYKYMYVYDQVLEATGTATLFVDLKTHSEEAVDAYVRASLSRCLV
jgi:hypothetical protein